MGITKLVIRYDLNPGLSDYRESLEWEKSFPAHRAGLALAMDYRDHRRIELSGSYGSATCHLYMVDENGDERPVETEDEFYDDDESAITENDAWAALPEGGEIDADAIHALRENVWDGNNHVPFFPNRAIEHLTYEQRVERDGHAMIHWYSNGSSEVTVDDGWEWLGDTNDETLEALDAAGVDWEELEEQTAIYDERQIIVDSAAFHNFQATTHAV